GNDSLFGSSGNDTLLGGVGDDSLNGGAGTDSLDGGVGNDIYTVDNVNDLIIEYLDAGTDLVNSSVNWVLGNNLENLTLTGTGAINGTGNSLNNILMGNNGANTLTGGDGNDSLFGNSGNDTLFGSAGDDLIAGGVGRDVLTGGTGQDSFNLTGTRIGGYDTIADFTLGEDTILISKAEFGLVQSQNTTLDSGLFRLGTTAITASDRFMYDQTTGNLSLTRMGLVRLHKFFKLPSSPIR
ncbi:calcium-binding protein, partial [Nostoc sp. 'Peltigera malacea cyanobiont' DB3992]|uniref:calcium-binding protein n=1 Tax=Nostoc sp. 'Peltigera malacea cyanobiont' DB3992 TaxID=1206980 RepID=UPI000C061FC4